MSGDKPSWKRIWKRIYMYNGVTLLCSRNEYGIVNQLYFNKILKIRELFCIKVNIKHHNHAERFLMICKCIGPIIYLKIQLWNLMHWFFKEKCLFKNLMHVEFLLWLSGLRAQQSVRRVKIWPLASLSGLRIRHCHELQCRCQMWLRSGVAVAVQ